MSFESLSLKKGLLQTLESLQYKRPTPIQAETIPYVLQGHDVIGCAQTGTGKTAAFALPTIQRLIQLKNNPTTGAEKRRHRSGRRVIRSLILSPTRELASQIATNLDTYSKNMDIRTTVIFGGVKQYSQVKALHRGVDILVATPGRLIDLGQQGHVDLSKVDILILDEADQMLDMGFIHDLKLIVSKVPEDRQTLMFSATMAPEIRRLAKQWLSHPKEVHVSPEASTPELVDQSVYFVERQNKQEVLTRFLAGVEGEKTLVFTRTKRGADKVTKRLNRDGIKAAAIHGDKSQAQRRRVMQQFGSHRPPVLVATDLASRGLDFSDISHVVNFELPQTPEVYVHRIGRTARAGTSGKAVSFCAGDERKWLRLIERLMRESVPVKKIADIDETLASMDVRSEDAGSSEQARSPVSLRRKGSGGHSGRRRWHSRNKSSSGRRRRTSGNRRSRSSQS